MYLFWNRLSEMSDLEVKVEAARSDYESSVCTYKAHIDQMEAQFRGMLAEKKLQLDACFGSDLCHREFRGWKPEYEEAVFDGRCSRGGGGGGGGLEQLKTLRQTVETARTNLTEAVQAEWEACAWKAEWELHELEQSTVASDIDEIEHFIENVNAGTPTFCNRTYPDYETLCTSLSSMTAQDLIEGWRNGCCDASLCTTAPTILFDEVVRR